MLVHSKVPLRARKPRHGQLRGHLRGRAGARFHERRNDDQLIKGVRPSPSPTPICSPSSPRSHRHQPKPRGRRAAHVALALRAARCLPERHQALAGAPELGHVVHVRGERRAGPGRARLSAVREATLAALVRIEGTLFVSGPARLPGGDRHGRASLSAARPCGFARHLFVEDEPHHAPFGAARRHRTISSRCRPSPIGRCLARHGGALGRGGLEMGIKGIACGQALLRGGLPAAPFLGSGFISTPKATFASKSPWNPGRWPRDSGYGPRTSRPIMARRPARTWST